MARFPDRTSTDAGLQLTIDGRAVPHDDVVGWRSSDQLGAPVESAVRGRRNLAGELERLAARGATPATRKQYAAIYRSFTTWLAAQVGRAPVVDELHADTIAAYHRHLEAHGGRHGTGAATATRRIYIALLRAAARELHGDQTAAAVKLPRHQPGPPETLTVTEYHNLLRVPDRRRTIGVRDYALLRVLGDCGLRSAEARGLSAGDLRRPRSNARHHRLYIHGKGGREREVTVPYATLEALDAWITVHPLARARRALLDHEPLFVRIGRHREQAPEPLSGQAVHKLVRRHALAAGIAERLCHPHALRTYWTTALLEDGMPVHRVKERLGHADLKTTARYAAEPPDHDDSADYIDRREHAYGRDRGR